MKSLAIIPARGGSKRIPRKNIKNFLGKPIIAYSIEAALKSNLFDEVMVSTDDEEIADIARNYGAAVPFFRSEPNSNDFASLNDVLEEVKTQYAQHNRYFETGCCILPTAPFISAASITEAYALLINGGFDSIRPIVKYEYPIQRALRLIDGRVEMIVQENYKMRSQDFEEAYHDAGQFYWFKMETLLKSTNRGGIEINSFETQDIDSIEDWMLAEKKYLLLETKSL